MPAIGDTRDKQGELPLEAGDKLRDNKSLYRFLRDNKEVQCKYSCIRDKNQGKLGKNKLTLIKIYPACNLRITNELE